MASDPSANMKTEQIELSKLGVAELGHLLGFDTDRKWATGVQIFLNPGHVLFVFKEEILTPPPADGSAPNKVARNVVSVVMPLEVARSFKEALSNVLPDVAV